MEVLSGYGTRIVCAQRMEREPLMPGGDLTVGVKLLAGKNDDSGFHAWTEEEVARFETKWPLGTRQRLAFDLLLYTGLRRGDAVRLGRPHVRNGEFTIRTEKTGMLVIAPILPALAASIAAAPTGELTFISTERGTLFTKESFGTWFGKVCRATKCLGSAHGLRKAVARRAAEDGATEEQLNALFGWADGSRESAVYTRTARRWRGRPGEVPYRMTWCGTECGKCTDFNNLIISWCPGKDCGAKQAKTTKTDTYGSGCLRLCITDL